jgi:3',5'-cyclic AMP phosphodiesterase CpdA
LRLTSINPKEINFFGQYSFDKVPKLPNHTPKVLDLLRNKVIVDPEELRSMDTTIWQVRPRERTDSVEKIYLTTHTLALPVSAEAVTSPSNTILHLTDPHFSIGDKREQHVWRLESEQEDSRPSLSQAVMNAIEMNKRQVGLVIVTGDLTFKGDPKEFKEAADALRQLLMRLKLDKNNLVVIPGNHDIVWAKGKERYKENARVVVAPEVARENYVAFHTELFGYPPNEYLSMGRRFSLPCGITLEVCAVNSSALATGKNFLAGMGYVQEEAMIGVSKELGWAETRSLALRLLAVHHHLALTENLEPAGEFYRGFGIAANAPLVMRLAAKHGVHLALHGHKHRAFVWRSKVYELPEQTQDRWYRGELSIIGGGSAGSHETQGRLNYFNLIDVSSEGLALEIYRADNDKADTGSFSVMQRWKADLNLDKTTSSLKLGDWTYVQPDA